MSDSAHDETLESAGEGGGDLDPQFRVISTGTRRRGVRLERVYWRLFDEIALKRQVKRSELLLDVLGGEGDDTENVSSAIRCFVALTIESERDALRQQVNPSHVIAMMQRAPVPAFAINRQKKLQQVNNEFMQLIRPDGSTGTRAESEYVHLSLDTPIGELFAALTDGRDTQCGYLLQVDDRRRRGRAKIVRVPGAVPETLVGYVLS